MSLTHWILSGHKPVAPEVAEARARICAICPLNEIEDLYESAKGVAARVIKAALRRKHEMKLTTAYTKDLHVCGACGCDLQLLVHAPSETLDTEKHLAELHVNCWQLLELKEAQSR
jgi:hypothetical protein